MAHVASLPPRYYSATARAVRNLLIALEALGADPKALLSAAGLALSDLDAARARVPRTALSIVWERAAETIPDPLLGLRVGATVPLGWWGLPEQLALHTPTLGEGIEAAIEFARLMADDKRFHLDCLGDRAAFVLRVGGDSPPTASSGWRHHAEADLVYAIRLVRTAVVTSSHRCAVTSRRLSGHLLCRFLWLLYRRHSRTNGFIDADGLAYLKPKRRCSP